MGQGDKARILILSDDGKYPDRANKNVFRGVWLQQAVAPTAEANAPTAAANVALRSGDMVFQDSSPHSGQAAAIKALTRSNWSHCGIYFERPNGEAVVIDGNGRELAVPWEKWRDHGEGKRFAAYRLRDQPSDEQLERLQAAANKYDGRPYDLKFAWDNEKIYCSELIWKAFHDALSLEVGRLQQLSDFDLRSPLARPLIEREGSWGSLANAEAHGNERVVSPEAITESELLQRIN
jgi:uncharacterized protein YycO